MSRELDEDQRAKIPQLFEFEDPATQQDLGGSLFSPFRRPSVRRNATIMLQQPLCERLATDICTDYLRVLGNEAIKSITKAKGPSEPTNTRLSLLSYYH
jgi:hypothetical protein